MRSPHPMNRLLQGDVGSGKTLVALCAMLIAVDQRLPGRADGAHGDPGRAALPHRDPPVRALGVRVTLLTGSRKGGSRRKALQEIASGWAQIVIGTHALIQDGVEFARLGLAVIDEQHRFGVDAARPLRSKGHAGAGHPGDDGHAHPAHPGHRDLRRHGPEP
jgi:ATP-dependent DNA helicase RecG